MRRTAHVLAIAAIAAGATLPGLTAAGAADDPVVTNGIVVESFDGTPIHAHFFLPAGASVDNPVPLVMRTHGWGGTGETAIGSGTLSKLLDNGYAVMTWDQRGFGKSGGQVEALKPEIEGADTSALIDWAVANVPELAFDDAAKTDPVVGFTGGSYAGGIQTSTAFLDDRVNAIAPEISWASLVRALYENDVANLGWASGLYGVGVATATGLGLAPDNPAGPQAGGLSPMIHQAYGELTATTQIMDSTLEFFHKSGLETYTQDASYGSPGIDVPALVINGTVDTLFDVTGGADIFHHVQSTGTDAKFVAFCGGHVACPSSYVDAGDRDHLDHLILNWFDKYLKGNDVDTGATVEYRTNEGIWRAADDVTPTDARWLEVSGDGAMRQSGVPATDPSGAPFQAEVNQDDFTGFAIEVAVAEGGPLEIVGIPEVTVDVSGLGDHAHVFAKLVDREAGHVINLQETAFRVNDLSGSTLSARMAGLAYTLPEGHHLDLELSTVSIMHQMARVPADLTVTASVRVPVLDTVVDAPTVTFTAPTAADASEEPTPEATEDATEQAAEESTEEPADDQSPVMETTTDTAPAAPADGDLPATGGGMALAGLGAVTAALLGRRRD